MTLKEKIMKLQTYKMFEGEDTVYVERDDILELLEKEPCEDAVSRQAVLDLCDSKDPEYKVTHFKEDVECLSSVYPKQNLDKIREEIERQEKWLMIAGYNAYNVDIALDAIKSAVTESEG